MKKTPERPSSRGTGGPPLPGAPNKTLSGLPVAPLYTESDLDGFDEGTDLGSPGAYPYTRGIYDSMYRGRLWTIRQLGSLGSATETNARIRGLIANGATGVSICFDMPTIMGRDSDDPLAEGEVGSCGGVAVDTLADMRTLLDGIALDEISINFVSNAQSAVILAMYAALAREQGIDWAKLSGTLQNDILKEYQAQKSYYFPPRPSMRLTVDTIRFCSDHLPRFNPISISGYHIGSAGATPLQELAFTLANGFTYVEAAMAVGLDVDRFAPRLSFFFKAHNDLFENVAKFRAARRIWARTLKEKYGARDPRSLRFRVHTQTSGAALTAQEPENNIIRVTLQALSAVLGGTQSLHTNAFDEAFSVPTPRSELLALRTQQIIAYESGVAATADPLAGSYYVETLTNQMEAGCQRYFEEIERQGGVIAGIEKGYFQRLIGDSAYAYQRAVQNRERIVVGLNTYASEIPSEVELRERDPALEQAKIRDLAAFKSRRNPSTVNDHLEAIRSAARSDDHMMPVILRAVEAELTLGEIVGALRDIFGVYREPSLY